MGQKPYLELGEFVTTHGVAGELKLYPWCDGPEFAAGLPRVFFGPNGEHETALEEARAHKGMCLMRLRGVSSLEEARAYVHRTVWCARADVRLPKGKYFVQDILGCAVENADTGEVYGRVTEVTHPAASDLYEVQNEAGEKFLFPAVPEFVVALQPEAGRVLVRPIPGMFTPEGGENADAD